MGSLPWSLSIKKNNYNTKLFSNDPTHSTSHTPVYASVKTASLNNIIRHHSQSPCNPILLQLRLHFLPPLILSSWFHNSTCCLCCTTNVIPSPSPPPKNSSHDLSFLLSSSCTSQNLTISWSNAAFLVISHTISIYQLSCALPSPRD